MGEDEKKLLIDIHKAVGVAQTQINNVGIKVDKHIEYTQQEFKNINDLDNKQNLILAEHKQSLDIHIEGVNTLREMYVAHRQEAKEELQMLREHLEVKQAESIARIESLEKPYDFIKYTGKVAVWLTGVLGIALGVLKIMEMWYNG